MTRKHIKHGLWWLGLRLKQEAFAIEHYRDTGRVRCAQGFGRAHIRILQPFTNVFPGADCGGGLASAPSPTVPSLFFNGLARTVGLWTRPLSSASWATVRRNGAAKPFPELVFGEDADGADGRVSA